MDRMARCGICTYRLRYTAGPLAGTLSEERRAALFHEEAHRLFAVGSTGSYGEAGEAWVVETMRWEPSVEESLATQEARAALEKFVDATGDLLHLWEQGKRLYDPPDPWRTSFDAAVYQVIHRAAEWLAEVNHTPDDN